MRAHIGCGGNGSNLLGNPPAFWGTHQPCWGTHLLGNPPTFWGIHLLGKQPGGATFSGNNLLGNPPFGKQPCGEPTFLKVGLEAYQKCPRIGIPRLLLEFGGHGSNFLGNPPTFWGPTFWGTRQPFGEPPFRETKLRVTRRHFGGPTFWGNNLLANPPFGEATFWGTHQPFGEPANLLGNPPTFWGTRLLGKQPFGEPTFLKVRLEAC